MSSNHSDETPIEKTSLVEDVFHTVLGALNRLLDIAFHLLGAALRLHAFVVSRLAGGLLDLALGLVSFRGKFLRCSHEMPPNFFFVLREYWRPHWGLTSVESSVWDVSSVSTDDPQLRPLDKRPNGRIKLTSRS